MYISKKIFILLSFFLLIPSFSYGAESTAESTPGATSSDVDSRTPEAETPHYNDDPTIGRHSNGLDDRSVHGLNDHSVGALFSQIHESAAYKTIGLVGASAVSFLLLKKAKSVVALLALLGFTSAYANTDKSLEEQFMELKRLEQAYETKFGVRLDPRCINTVLPECLL